jgi:uncharacterized protein YjbI with pentapeptide repeats
MRINCRTWLSFVFSALSSVVILNMGCPSNNASKTMGERLATFETFETFEADETVEAIERRVADEDFEESEEYDWKPFVPGDSLEYPWDPGRRRRYVAPRDQRNADFSGRNLLGYTFNDVDARDATFDGADLRHAVFAYNSKLLGASFRRADLRRARFIRCDRLTLGNDITDALINDMWSSWRNEHMPGVFEFTEQQLRSTKSFKAQNLSGCRLLIRGAPALDLRHFDLRNMVIQMDFSNCRMEGADLSGSIILRGSKIAQEQILSTSAWPGDDFRWAGSELSIYCPIEDMKPGNSWLDSVSFNPQGADLTGAFWRLGPVTFLEGTLTKEQLYSTTNYKRRNLRNVTFRGLEDIAWDFTGQDLSDAAFLERWSTIRLLSLPRADFTDAIVTRTRIDLTLDQFVSTWNYKNGVFKTFKGMTREEIEKLLSERTASEPASDSGPEQMP